MDKESDGVACGTIKINRKKMKKLVDLTIWIKCKKTKSFSEYRRNNKSQNKYYFLNEWRGGVRKWNTDSAYFQPKNQDGIIKQSQLKENCS